jgi:hypothetical protein
VAVRTQVRAQPRHIRRSTFAGTKAGF